MPPPGKPGYRPRHRPAGARYPIELGRIARVNSWVDKSGDEAQVTTQEGVIIEAARNPQNPVEVEIRAFLRDPHAVARFGGSSALWLAKKAGVEAAGDAIPYFDLVMDVTDLDRSWKERMPDIALDIVTIANPEVGAALQGIIFFYSFLKHLEAEGKITITPVDVLNPDW
jgi:hypothetical protein